MKLLSVRVVSPDGEIGKYQAQSVSSINSAGKFDVLPGHANFVTFVDSRKVKLTLEDKQELEIDYPVAILRVNNDVVTIFVDVETLKAI